MAGADARPPPISAGRWRQAALPRRRRDGEQLPGDALPGGSPADGNDARATGGAGAAHGANDRERVRPDGADRTRRLVDRRGPPGRPGRARAGSRAAVSGAGGRDAAVKVLRTIAEARDSARALRSAGTSIGLVPTMGALHAGHLSLVRAARAENDVTAVTIF